MFTLHIGPTRSTQHPYLIQSRGPPSLGWGSSMFALNL